MNRWWIGLGIASILIVLLLVYLFAISCANSGVQRIVDTQGNVYLKSRPDLPEFWPAPLKIPGNSYIAVSSFRTDFGFDPSDGVSASNMQGIVRRPLKAVWSELYNSATKMDGYQIDIIEDTDTRLVLRGKRDLDSERSFFMIQVTRGDKAIKTKLSHPQQYTKYAMVYMKVVGQDAEDPWSGLE